MRKFQIFSLYFFAVAALSWFLPWLFGLLAPKTGAEPFAQYSPVANCWVLTVSNDDKQIMMYTIDAEGNPVDTLTDNERDSLLPQTYYRDLMARNVMPDSLNGKELSVPAIRHAEVSFKSTQRDINRPTIGVYMMMESMPKRADLEDPEEVFTFSDGRMIFTKMATNEENTTRSERFTNVLKQRGFTWPLRDASANITARKQRDDGYLLADSAGRVYHLKQQAGRPYCAIVNLPDSVEAAHVFIFENLDPRMLGLVVDTEHNAWVVLSDGYQAVKLPVSNVDPTKQRINIMGNLFALNFRAAGADSTCWTAINADTFEPLARYTYVKPQHNIDCVRGYIFPYILNFNSNNDAFAYPRLSAFSANALILNAVLAIILLVVTHRRRQGRAGWVLAALTVPFGLYLFIPALLLKE